MCELEATASSVQPLSDPRTLLTFEPLLWSSFTLGRREVTWNNPTNSVVFTCHFSQGFL